MHEGDLMALNSTRLALLAAVMAMLGLDASGSIAGTMGAPDPDRSVSVGGAGAIDAVLDRWQPVALRAGAYSSAWREMYGIQLAQMPGEIRMRFASMQPGRAQDAKADYAKFVQAFVNAQATIYNGDRGVTQQDAAKLASATSDLVFIPIPPCRIVDSRSALGP